jgi:REP-associated tyrosine transposase
MFRISKDSPAYYLTSVAKNRLPVFRTTAVKNIACSALDEAHRSAAGFLLLAYVLMTDHLHAIVGSELKPSKVLQYVNGIVAHRVIGFLKTNGHELSLKKIMDIKKDREYKYSLWDHHPQAKVLTSEDVVLQKVNYVHQNPVRACLVKRAEEYRWSSVRCWAGTALEDEPLIMDIDKIAWRAGRRGRASR